MAKERSRKDSATSQLQHLDLSENEAILYRQIIERPPATVQELVNYAPFPRTMLYYVLKQLVRRGLVSTRKDEWRTVYIAEDPEHLYDLLARKQREFDRDVATVRTLIPRLKNEYRLAGKRTSVRTFTGTEEYQKALDDMIVSDPAEVCSYEVLATQKSAFEVRESHERRRVALKILRKVLIFDSIEEITALKKRQYDDFTQFRTVTGGPAPFQVDVMMYEGKILYTSYYDVHEPTAVLIEDHTLYQMQKNIFDNLWKNGKDRTLAYIEHV